MSEKANRRFQFSLRTLLVVMVVCAIASAGNPLVLLLLLYCGFFAYLVYSASQLPPRMASHFNFRGKADQWMNRTAYLWLIGSLALVVPLLMPAIALAMEKTEPYFVRHSLWFGCLIVGLLFAMHVRVVQANRETPPELSHMWPIMFLFAACSMIWVITVVVFQPGTSRVPAAKKVPAAPAPIAPQAIDTP